MKHAEALKEMEKLAGNQYWTLDHISNLKDGSYIRGYIASKGFGLSAPNYAGAIENVKMMLGLIPCDPAPEDEQESERSALDKAIQEIQDRRIE